MAANTTDVDNKTIEDRALSVDDMVDLLSDDKSVDEPIKLDEEDDTKKSKTKKAKADDDTETKDEDKDEELTIEDELEDELSDEDKTEDELENELIVPARKREILAKFPTLFKDFPYLEKAYYREQKYAELLPTIADAEAAIEKANNYDEIARGLSEGSTVEVLKDLKKNDEESFNKLVDNYLINLEQADSNAYYHVIGNTIKHTILAMISEKDDDLTEAARILNLYIFGKKNFENPTNLSKTQARSQEEDKISQREKEFTERQFNTVQTDLSTRVNNILKSTIDKNIDPRDSMSSFVKKHATTEAMENLEDLISKDNRFTAILDKLWERAFNDNLSDASIERIRSAYLSKAKTLLPSVIKKSRNEALRGLGKKTDDDNDANSMNVRDKKGPLPVGDTRKSTSSSSSSSGKSDRDKAKEIPKNMSTLDYLMKG